MKNRIIRIQIPSKIHRQIKGRFVKIKVNNTSLIEKISEEKVALT